MRAGLSGCHLDDLPAHPAATRFAFGITYIHINQSQAKLMTSDKGWDGIDRARSRAAEMFPAALYEEFIQKICKLATFKSICHLSVPRCVQCMQKGNRQVYKKTKLSQFCAEFQCIKVLPTSRKSKDGRVDRHTQINTHIYIYTHIHRHSTYLYMPHAE